MVVSKDERVIIVGAGCFGLSTAYHLLQRGFTDVTVLDRSQELPAPDAASNDLNKVVRTSSSSMFYAQLARDAIQEWKKTDEWGDAYRECGVLVLGSADDQPYAVKAYANDVVLGVRTAKLDAGDAVRSVFPANVKTGTSLECTSGYFNLDSGWALAARGVEKLMTRVITLGGKVVGESGRTSGVTLADGSCMSACLVVIASGSWTASTFRELELSEMCLSTGDVPVLLNFHTGFYIFPPTDDNIIKFAFHDSGVVYHAPGDIEKPVSTPRTVSSHGEDGLRVPQSSLKRLRSALRTVYPELAEKPFTATRLCWYTDSPDSHWVIGYYPSDSGLLLATSGSGHAYKFLPVVGRIVADAIEGTLDPALVQRFAVDRTNGLSTDWFDRRHGLAGVVDLATEQLCTPEDLLP
ncbi:FAD dependent oxidoreductase [Lactifluus subvellereus]|nr:FAD dependent oxidoreductase [Lactifluus subvellereus]